jgi:hypothetical protein
MAYFIFLKYLRSLEEFRKNPHVKIPPKSPCAKFQSLGIFKNVIFIQKGIFFRIQPIRPIPSRAGLLRSQATGSPLSPLGPSHVGVNCRKSYSLRLCALRRDVLSLSRHCHVGPACQLHPLPHAGRPLPLLLIAYGHPAPPGLQPRDARRGLHSTP